MRKHKISSPVESLIIAGICCKGSSMRMNVVRSLQGAVRASTSPNHGSSCRGQSFQQFTIAAHSLGRQATVPTSHGGTRVACRRNWRLGNSWVTRRASSTFPDDALYLPMPKLSPSMVRSCCITAKQYCHSAHYGASALGLCAHATGMAKCSITQWRASTR